MLALEVIVGLAVLVGVALVATGRFDTLDEEPVDTSDLGLPVGRPLRSADIPRLRFRAVGGVRGGLRGYRMADVDAAMARVHEALQAAEERAAAGEGGRMSGSEPQPPMRPAPPPEPDRPTEPEPLPAPPEPPMRPEPPPVPEPPVVRPGDGE